MGRDEDGGCGIGYIACRYQGRWISASRVLDGGFAYGVCLDLATRAAGTSQNRETDERVGAVPPPNVVWIVRWGLAPLIEEFPEQEEIAHSVELELELELELKAGVQCGQKVSKT